MDNLKDGIDTLSQAPASQLAPHLAERCSEWMEGDREDGVAFLEELLSDAVMCGGASPFVMAAMLEAVDTQGGDDE